MSDINKIFAGDNIGARIMGTSVFACGNTHPIFHCTLTHVNEYRPGLRTVNGALVGTLFGGLGGAMLGALAMPKKKRYTIVIEYDKDKKSAAVVDEYTINCITAKANGK